MSWRYLPRIKLPECGPCNGGGYVDSGVDPYTGQPAKGHMVFCPACAIWRNALDVALALINAGLNNEPISKVRFDRYVKELGGDVVRAESLWSRQPAKAGVYLLTLVFDNLKPKV